MFVCSRCWDWHLLAHASACKPGYRPREAASNSANRCIHPRCAPVWIGLGVPRQPSRSHTPRCTACQCAECTHLRSSPGMQRCRAGGQCNGIHLGWRLLADRVRTCGGSSKHWWGRQWAPLGAAACSGPTTTSVCTTQHGSPANKWLISAPSKPHSPPRLSTQ